MKYPYNILEPCNLPIVSLVKQTVSINIYSKQLIQKVLVLT